MKSGYQCTVGAKMEIRDARQCERSRAGFGRELTGATAVFNLPVMKPWVVEDITFLCVIITANDKRDEYERDDIHVCIVRVPHLWAGQSFRLKT